MWKYSKDGEFSTKSAYAIANTPHEPNPSFQGQRIWKLDVLPKIVNFLWLCIHNSAPVKHALASRGITNDSTCPLRKTHSEKIGIC